jgi:hypothetical protein
MASRFSFSSGVNGRLSGVKLMLGISGDWEGDSVGDWAEDVPMNRTLTAAAGINLHAMFRVSAIPPICSHSGEAARSALIHLTHYPSLALAPFDLLPETAVSFSPGNNAS